MKKAKVFVNTNLDGAGCLLLLNWAVGDKYTLDVTETPIFNFPETYETFKSSKVKKQYAAVFVLNLNCGVELAPGTVSISKDASSGTTASFVALNALSGLLDGKISPQKTKLIPIINDFYNESGVVKDSWKLHAIFCSLKHSPKRFMERFIDGFSEYQPEDKPEIQKYKDSIGKTYASMSTFESKNGIFIGIANDIEKNVMLLDIVFKIYHPKLFFLVNFETKDVCIRKDPSLELDLNVFCGKLIDGLAFRNKAGGKITEKFVNFSKEFTPCQGFKTK